MPRLYDEAERPRHPAVTALRSVMNYDDYFDDEQCGPARDRLLLRPRQLPRRQYRQGPRGARSGGPDAIDARDLHLRPRRQSRLPRAVGQVGDV